MNARSGYEAGEICRAELQARDIAAARSFYARVLGWHFEDLPVPGGRTCSKVLPDIGPATVIAAHNQQQEVSGAPARWGIYFAVADAQAVAEEAPYAGGGVQSGPEAAPDGGVRALLTAPGGGATGVWQAGAAAAAAWSDGPGALAWAELVTPEPQAAVAFFQQLFGHDVTEYPQEDGGTYTTLMANGVEVAGIAPLAGDGGSTASGHTASGGTGAGEGQWQVYFGVADVAEAVEAAVAAGAAVLVEPGDSAGETTEDGGEDDVVATLQDPQGAVFSLVQVQSGP